MIEHERGMMPWKISWADHAIADLFRRFQAQANVAKDLFKKKHFDILWDIT